MGRQRLCVLGTRVYVSPMRPTDPFLGPPHVQLHSQIVFHLLSAVGIIWVPSSNGVYWYRMTMVMNFDYKNLLIILIYYCMNVDEVRGVC